MSENQFTRPWHASYAAGTKKEIDPVDHPHLPAMLRETAQTYGKKQAFLTCMPNGMNGSLSFKEVDQKSDAFAVYLREKLGLQQGDRVAIQMPNCLSYPIVTFGVFKAGLVLVNTNPLYTASEMRHQFSDAGVKALVIINMFTDKLEKIKAEVPVEHVIISRITDFFPSMVGKVIDIIQKYWNQQIPQHSLEHDSFRQAVSWGQKRLKKADGEQLLASYLEGIGHDSMAVLQYTGGTTGVSKGAVLTHYNLMSNMHQVMEMLGDKLAKGEETILTALPMYHIFAFTVNLLGFYYIGCRSILIPSPRPLTNLKRAFENYQVTWLSAVNTLLNGLCNEVWFQDYPPKHLKATAAGGMALQQVVRRRWEEMVHSPVVEGFGLTEASPVLSFNPFEGLEDKEGIGVPIPSTDMKCMDEEGNEVALGEPGEIWAKGPQIMKGYWNRDDETAKTLTSDGWLKTGDIGTMDKDGYFKIVDRKKDMIVVSGFNVFPNEVEDVLAKNDKIEESAVIGVSDEKTTEAVKAFIVKKDASLTSEEVIGHCKEFLTGYKVPKIVEFRDELPKSPVGKILRKELRQ